MATQYTLDLATASAASDAALQSVISYLNPSIGSLSSAALEEFQQQLESIGSGGSVSLTQVVVDPNSTSANPLFDVAFAGTQGTSADPNVYQAGEGFDTITGVNNDVAYGSSSPFGAAKLIATTGNETLYGGQGNDTLYAGSGNDTLFGGSGDQTLVGSSSHTGHALLEGGDGNQKLYAGQGSDTLYGGSGNDTLYGGSGASTLHAGSGHDTMYGGSGPTTFVVTQATFNNDLIVGGTGTNVLNLTDLNASDVAVHTANGVTTVDFGGNELTLKGVNSIHFANGQSVTLH